jgi:hypothetical protein
MRLEVGKMSKMKIKDLFGGDKESKVKADAEIKAKPEVKADAEIKTKPEVKTDAETKTEPEVKAARKVKWKPRVNKTVSKRAKRKKRF